MATTNEEKRICYDCYFFVETDCGQLEGLCDVTEKKCRPYYFVCRHFQEKGTQSQENMPPSNENEF